MSAAHPVAGELPPLPVQAVCDVIRENNMLTEYAMGMLLNGDAVALNSTTITAIVNKVNASRPVQQPAAVAGQEPFGTYVEREDGTAEFQRTGKAFQGTVHGYKAWTLYTAPVPAAGVQGDGPVMGISITGNEPDSGRDAALRLALTELQNCEPVFSGKFGVYERAQQHDAAIAAVQAALAAHPAPSSDAAARRDPAPSSDAAKVEQRLRSLGQMPGPWPSGAAHPANGAQADLVAKINALRVRGVNYEDGVPARRLVDRAEVLALLALLGGAS